eukprot:36917_1
MTDTRTVICFSCKQPKLFKEYSTTQINKGASGRCKTCITASLGITTPRKVKKSTVPLTIPIGDDQEQPIDELDGLSEFLNPSKDASKHETDAKDDRTDTRSLSNRAKQQNAQQQKTVLQNTISKWTYMFINKNFRWQACDGVKNDIDNSWTITYCPSKAKSMMDLKQSKLPAGLVEYLETAAIGNKHQLYDTFHTHFIPEDNAGNINQNIQDFDDSSNHGINEMKDIIQQLITHVNPNTNGKGN